MEIWYSGMESYLEEEIFGGALRKKLVLNHPLRNLYSL